MEKLSIVVPVYNIVNYLEECVDSLIGQEYYNCEIILVDDGSTDGSSELCDNLLKRDERITVIHQKNGGLSSARNSGIRNASGQYISFIDSDDYVAPDMFSKLIAAIEKTDASVAICNFTVFNKEHQYYSKRYGNNVIKYSSETQIDFYAAALDSSCNRVFKAEVIREQNLVFEHKNIVAQEDYWFQIRLFSHIRRIVTLDDNMYFYRERGSSITKSHSDGDITKRNLSFYALTQEYVQKNTQRSISHFMKYLLVNLFCASINNASSTSPKVILDIVSQYESVPEFIESISAESIRSIVKGISIRDKYTKATYWLLRHKMNNAFAVLETVRLKRLRSNDRTALYYK